MSASYNANRIRVYFTNIICISNASPYGRCQPPSRRLKGQGGAVVVPSRIPPRTAAASTLNVTETKPFMAVHVEVAGQRQNEGSTVEKSPRGGRVADLSGYRAGRVQLEDAASQGARAHKDRPSRDRDRRNIRPPLFAAAFFRRRVGKVVGKNVHSNRKTNDFNCYWRRHHPLRPRPPSCATRRISLGEGLRLRRASAPVFARRSSSDSLGSRDIAPITSPCWCGSMRSARGHGVRDILRPRFGSGPHSPARYSKRTAASSMPKSVPKRVGAGK